MLPRKLSVDQPLMSLPMRETQRRSEETVGQKMQRPPRGQAKLAHARATRARRPSFSIPIPLETCPSTTSSTTRHRCGGLAPSRSRTLRGKLHCQLRLPRRFMLQQHQSRRLLRLRLPSQLIWLHLHDPILPRMTWPMLVQTFTTRQVRHLCLPPG